MVPRGVFLNLIKPNDRTSGFLIFYSYILLLKYCVNCIFNLSKSLG